MRDVAIRVGHGCRGRARDQCRRSRADGGCQRASMSRPGSSTFTCMSTPAPARLRSYAGDNSVYPDGFTFRAGVTTVVDAGSSGWRNFDDFQSRVIARFTHPRARVPQHRRPRDARSEPSSRTSATWRCSPLRPPRAANRDTIVGIKTAHYAGPEWAPVERAVEAGTAADVPVMVDFGRNQPERPLAELVTTKLRPGDIYTHVYSGSARRAGSTRAPEPRLVRRTEARGDLRRRSRRRQLSLAGRRPRRSARAFCRIRFRPISTSAA